MFLPKIPRAIIKALFRSFESGEGFSNQVAQLKEFAPDRPIAFAFFNAGFIEFLAVRLFLQQRFGKSFELNMAMGISRFWLDFFSGSLKRVATAFHVFPRRNLHDRLCKEQLQKGNPILLNFNLEYSNKNYQVPKGERALMELKKEFPTLLVVPVVLVWRRAGRYKEETPKDLHTWFMRALAAPFSIPWYFLLGDPYSPRGLRKLLLMIRGYSKSMMRVADVIEASEHDERKIRRQSYRSIQQEKRILLGPTYKSTSLLSEQILRNNDFGEFVKKLSAEEKQTETFLLKRAASLLKEMAAKYSYFVTEVASWILERIFNSIYKGVSYRKEEIEALREDSRLGSIIFIPNHRSYFDFLLLSYVLYKEHFMAPHVIAGINLNFWPMGSFLKRAGAIFIRRSFRGDRLYAEVLQRYVNSLINSRIPLEFFIEGARSRTGKLVPPRYGILKMIYESYLQKHLNEDVRLVPVSITYDKVTEDRAHKRELEGAKKQEENMVNLLRSSKALFKSYGHVHLRFAKSIPLQDWTKTEEVGERFGIQKLAFEICHRINQSIPITALGLVCAVLTAKPGAAMSKNELKQWLLKVRVDIGLLGLPLTAEMQEDFDSAINKAIELLLEEQIAQQYDVQDDADVGIRIADKNRIQALYYKNNVIHCFVMPAIAGLCRSTDRDKVKRLRDFLEFEFFFPEKEAFFEELRRLDSKLSFSFYAHMIDDVLETVETGLLLLQRSPKIKLSAKEWTSRYLKFGKQCLLEASLKRPESVNTQSFKAFLDLGQVEGWVSIDEKTKDLEVKNLSLVSSALEDLRYYREQLPSWEKVQGSHLVSLSRELSHSAQTENT